jgi:hypothetical protein
MHELWTERNCSGHRAAQLPARAFVTDRVGKVIGRLGAALLLQSRGGSAQER